MLFPAILSGGFALTANAFLLPPGIAKEYQAAKDNIAPVLGGQHSQTINLDCSTCPYALASQRNGRHEWTNDVKSGLEMKFTAEDQSLKLNGVPFYPVAVPFVPAPLFAKQIIKDEGQKAALQKGFEGNLRLSYSVEFEKNNRIPPPTQDASVVEITMSVMALDNEMVHLDDIKIKALSLSAVEKSKPEVSILLFP